MEKKTSNIPGIKEKNLITLVSGLLLKEVCKVIMINKDKYQKESLKEMVNLSSVCRGSKEKYLTIN